MYATFKSQYHPTPRVWREIAADPRGFNAPRTCVLHNSSAHRVELLDARSTRHTRCSSYAVAAQLGYTELDIENLSYQ